MTRKEYEASKARIEEHLRVGVELLQAAYRQQMEALELVWRGHTEEPAAIVPARVEETPVPRRRCVGELYGEIQDALSHLPEVFHRGHVCDQLGYQPDRSSVYRALQELVAEGFLAVQTPGDNRRPTLYRRTNVAGRTGG